MEGSDAMIRPGVLGADRSVSGRRGHGGLRGRHVGGARDRESAEVRPGHLLGRPRPRAARAAAGSPPWPLPPHRSDSRAWGESPHRGHRLTGAGVGGREGSEQLCHGIQQKIQSRNSKTHTSFPFVPQMQNNSSSKEGADGGGEVNTRK